jgi:hypothetical protein
MHMERETERDLSRVADGLSPTRKIGFLTDAVHPNRITLAPIQRVSHFLFDRRDFMPREMAPQNTFNN